MNVRATIKPKSKKAPLIQQKSDSQGDFFEIHTKEPAIEGRANQEAIKILSKHLSLPKTKISIKLGQKSRFKIFSINDILE